VKTSLQFYLNLGWRRGVVSFQSKYLSIYRREDLQSNLTLESTNSINFTSSESRVALAAKCTSELNPHS